MNISLTNKNALVCGSSKGIGKACAVELALLGANVTLVARNEDELKHALHDLDTSKHQRHDYLVADFSFPQDLKARVAEKLKSKTFHILVNNTGGPAAGEITHATEEQFISAFEHHLLCNHILATLLLEGMKKENYGRIINIISTSVKIPLKGLGVSNTIRAAVANWSKTLANEVAQFGITVNNVLPGGTNTDRLNEILKSKAHKTGKTIAEIETEMIIEIPMKRFGSPIEVGSAVAFLASPAAAYITGINLPVDGGRTGSL